MEKVVRIGEDVAENYLGDDITHQLVEEEKLTLKSEFVPGRTVYVWDLVWEGWRLEAGMKYKDLVQDHGMSVDEFVDVYVVYRDPASPRDHRTITLHFYLPSGEFIMEEVVRIGENVDVDYLGDHITHQLVAEGNVTLTSEFPPDGVRTFGNSCGMA